MKKIIIFVGVALLFTGSWAADLASWENDGVNGAEATLPADDYHASLIAAPELSRGAGTPFPQSGYKDTFCISGCNLGSLDEVVGAGQYITWIVDPAAGSTLSLSSIMLRLSAQDAGDVPVSVALFSSAAGFTSADAIDTWEVGGQGPNSSLNVEYEVSLASVPALQSVTAPVEFRLYAWGGVSQYAQFGIGKPYNNDGGDDLVIKGTLAP